MYFRKYLENQILKFCRSGEDDEEEFQSHFEAELAQMDMDDDFDVNTLKGEGPEAQNTCNKWSRPALPFFDPKTDSIEFQQVEIDHYIGQPMIGMPGAQVRIYNH